RAAHPPAAPTPRPRARPPRPCCLSSCRLLPPGGRGPLAELQYALRGERQPGRPLPYRIGDGIGDGGRARGNGRLTDATGVQRALALAAFDDLHLDIRHV